MTFKKGVDLQGMSKERSDFLDNLDPLNLLASKGIGGDKNIEPIPLFNKTDAENVVQNECGSYLVLGRDRNASKLSGYGGLGHTQCASIDLVTGRFGHAARTHTDNGEELYADPNFESDAARIYISQKTDVDHNFGLADGQVGKVTAKSAIALKADGIRIIARESIKLITGTDIENSQGGGLQSVVGIDLIAGNDDTDLQPLVKGRNLEEALKQMVQRVSQLNGIVDGFLMSQMEMNEALTHHFHQSPFFGSPTTPALTLVPRGIKVMIDQLAKTKRDLVSHKANLATYELTYLNPVGKNYINSRYNNTN